MRARGAVICIIAVAASVVAGVGFASGDKAPAPPKEHDFGSKVLVVETRTGPERRASTHVFLEKAKIRLLAGQHFLVGTGVDMGPGFEQHNGNVIWTPMTQVSQIVEHENVEKVKKILSLQKAE